jgi:hypothetical protein
VGLSLARVGAMHKHALYKIGMQVVSMGACSAWLLKRMPEKGLNSEIA